MIFLRSRWRAVAVVTGALILFSALDAHGCACCTDPGEYSFTPDGPITDFHRTQLEGIKFGLSARLYLTDAGEDAVKGISNITEENTLSAVFEARRWRLTFQSADGQPGVLTLPMPAKISTLAADIHDGEAGAAPTLYKEWRLEGVATGDGIFRAGFAAPVKYTLVFQGRGNRCDNADDFTHWRLEISGKKASYAFFGELVVPGNGQE
jgi:hypothetical protein